MPALLQVLPLVILAACQTGPAPVVAPPPPPASIARLYERPAERALVGGIRLYDEGALDRAEVAFKTALGAGLQNPHDVAVAHKYLAFIGCAFNRLPECEQSFRDAIAADPTFRLSDAEIGHPIWGPVYKRVLASPPAPAPAVAPSVPPAAGIGRP